MVHFPCRDRAEQCNFATSYTIFSLLWTMAAPSTLSASLRLGGDAVDGPARVQPVSRPPEAPARSGHRQRASRRRRPSGEPPPLPRHVGKSGLSWLAAALTLVALSVGLFSAGWRGPAVAVSVADDAVVRWLSGISGPGYLGVMRALAALSSFWLMTATLWALVVALLLLRRLRHLMAFLLVWNLGAQLYFVVGPAAQRPRPFGVPIRTAWSGWALPSLPIYVLAAVVVGLLYTLVPEGRWRNVGKLIGFAVVGCSALGRVALGADGPLDVLVAAAMGVTLPLVAFRVFTPRQAFPVNYRRGRSAHLDIGGARGKRSDARWRSNWGWPCRT